MKRVLVDLLLTASSMRREYARLAEKSSSLHAQPGFVHAIMIEGVSQSSCSPRARASDGVACTCTGWSSPSTYHGTRTYLCLPTPLPTPRPKQVDLHAVTPNSANSGDTGTQMIPEALLARFISLGSSTMAHFNLLLIIHVVPVHVDLVRFMLNIEFF